MDRKPKTKKRFLIIKLWAIGDSILCLSLARAIKEKFKGSEVDVVTTSRVRDVFESYEGINSVYSPFQAFFKLRKYDVVFDCEPYLNLSAIIAFFLGKQRIGFANQIRSRLYNIPVMFKKNQHMVENYLDMIRSLGIKYDTKTLERLSVKNSQKRTVELFIKKNKLKNKLIIGITPGVAETVKARMWFEERFAKLSDRLIEKLNAKIIFIDSASNKRIVGKITSMMKNKAIDASGKFNLKETFYLISKCNVYISNDTGPVHIAAAQGCKTIGLYGPNTPALWRPYGKNNIAIYKTKLPPSIDNVKGLFIDKNREGYMGPITVTDVFNAVRKLTE